LNLSSGASDASSSSSDSLMLIERIIARFTTKDTKKHEPIIWFQLRDLCGLCLPRRSPAAAGRRRAVKDF
jgi:hypothetical protein